MYIYMIDLITVLNGVEVDIVGYGPSKTALGTG